MKSCDPLLSKQCLRYQVKINTAKLSFFLPSHSNSGDLISPKPLLYKILSEWNFRQVAILWFHVVHLQSNTQTQRFCLPKHPKTAHPTCLTKRCAESGTPCQSHFSGVLGSSGKKWPNGPNFSPLQFENCRPWYSWSMKSNVNRDMFWRMPTMCGLNTSTLKRSEVLNFLKYLYAALKDHDLDIQTVCGISVLKFLMSTVLSLRWSAQLLHNIFHWESYDFSSPDTLRIIGVLMYWRKMFWNHLSHVGHVEQTWYLAKNMHKFCKKPSPSKTYTI